MQVVVFFLLTVAVDRQYCQIHMTFDFKSTHVHNLIYFFPSGHGNEFCNLIGFKRSPDFPFSDHGHSNVCMTFFRELTKSFEREEKNK